MRRRMTAVRTVIFVVAVFFSTSVHAQKHIDRFGSAEARELLDMLGVDSSKASSAPCIEGEMPSGALYRICLPDAWNGRLVLYAHGYVEPGDPLALPYEAAFFGEVLNGLGFAFGVTSYRMNGFSAAKWGEQDVLDVVDLFASTYAVPERTIVVGTSLGGCVAAQLAEERPDVFDGGLSLCGVSGSFYLQIMYMYDFRVLFDYFFPGLMPGPAVSIPGELIENWDTVYRPAVEDAVCSNSAAREQLFSTGGVTVDTGNTEMMLDAVVRLLRYNIFAVNDAVENLGGSPYQNLYRSYSGSDNDTLLNAQVARHTADIEAVLEVKDGYETSGSIAIPFVAMHTLGDYVVPFDQVFALLTKVQQSGVREYVLPVPVSRYGHCMFTPREVLYGFTLLLWNIEQMHE